VRYPSARSAALAAMTLLLFGCSGVSLDLLTFGGTKEQDTSRAPAGATTYQCADGKRLFVRYLDNGAAAWVILPDREFRLSRSGANTGGRYSNGSDSLEVGDKSATLSDGATVTHADCKAAAG
jgi:hypothetical protein